MSRACSECNKHGTCAKERKVSSGKGWCSKFYQSRRSLEADRDRLAAELARVRSAHESLATLIRLRYPRLLERGNPLYDATLDAALAQPATGAVVKPIQPKFRVEVDGEEIIELLEGFIRTNGRVGISAMARVGHAKDVVEEIRAKLASPQPSADAGRAPDSFTVGAVYAAINRGCGAGIPDLGRCGDRDMMRKPILCTSCRTIHGRMADALRSNQKDDA